MATGATYVDFGSEKRLLGRSDFDDRFLGHLRELVQENMEKVYRTGVVYDVALSLSAGGNDKFSIGGSSLATDGAGHLLDIANSGFEAGVQFENTAAIDYEIALHYTEVPDGVQVNPRKGLPEFIGVQEMVGESADPDLVVDGGGSITLRVDSVAEAGVSHAGRTVRVFKKVPGKNATTPAVAIEDVVVSWTGTNNEITISGVLGQDSVSTTPSDYTVVMLGPTVRRNSTLLGVDEYAFIGKVTGIGSGSPPVTFDITEQDVITASLSDLQDVTSRNSTTDRLKIDVKSYAGDVGDPQIAVRSPAGAIVFEVDGSGNVVIQGTTTQQDVVQVNSSETITDNLTAGDATADSHLIKGIWRHTDPGETANYFYVDGASGRIGFNRTQDATYQVAVSGDTLIQGDLRIESALPSLERRETDSTVTAGGLWRSIIDGGDWELQENTAAGGDFTSIQNWLRTDRANGRLMAQSIYPNTTGAFDLGGASFKWRNIYIDQIAYIDKIDLGIGSGEGVGSHVYPDFDDSRHLGSASRRFAEAHIRTISLDPTAGFGVGSSMMPTADITHDLGSASRQWNNLFVGTLHISSDFLPTIDNTQDLGSTTRRWQQGHYGHVTGNKHSVNIGDVAVLSGGTGFMRMEKKSTTPWITGSNTNEVLVVSDVDTHPDDVSHYTALHTFDGAVAGRGFSFMRTSVSIGPTAATEMDGVIGFGAACQLDGTGTKITGNRYGFQHESTSFSGGAISNGTEIAFYAEEVFGDFGYGLKVDAVSAVGYGYGVYIGGVTGASTQNYAIYTNTGALSIGDTIIMRQISAPGLVANAGQIYSKDVAGTAHVFVQDEAGNETQISPHSKDGEWIYFSRNIKTGREVRIEMEKLVKAVERMTGEQFMVES